jgi:hypothetical protein
MKALIASTLSLASLLALASGVRAVEGELNRAIGAWPELAGPTSWTTSPSGEPSRGPFGGESRESTQVVAEAATPWCVELTLYLWATSLDIKSTLPGNDSGHPGGDVDLEADLSFTDLLEGALSGRVEGWYGDLGAIVDFGFLRLGNELELKGDGPAGVTRESESEFDGVNVFLGVAWRITGDPVAADPRRAGFYGDLIGGLRYNSISLSVETSGGGDLDADHSFVEPVLGARAGYHFCTAFSLSARAEVGGFGLGDLPDYDILVLLESRFRVTSWLELDLGYQWKWLDFSDGDFELEAIYAGPWLGLTIRF